MDTCGEADCRGECDEGDAPAVLKIEAKSYWDEVPLLLFGAALVAESSWKLRLGKTAFDAVKGVLGVTALSLCIDGVRRPVGFSFRSSFNAAILALVGSLRGSRFSGGSLEGIAVGFDLVCDTVFGSLPTWLSVSPLLCRAS